MLVNFRSVPSPGEKLVREILRGPRIFVRAEVRIAPSFCLARRSALGSIPAVSAYGSAEARDSTDGLPLTVREQSFVLGPPDGKVCPRPWENASEVWVDAPCFSAIRLPQSITASTRDRNDSGIVSPSGSARARVVSAVRPNRLLRFLTSSSGALINGAGACLSLNDLVGAGENRVRHGDAEHPSCLSVHNELKLRRSHNRQV